MLSGDEVVRMKEVQRGILGLMSHHFDFDPSLCKYLSTERL